MKISANSIKKGNILNVKNKLYTVLKTDHVKPGKGGAFVQLELKGVDNDLKIYERIRSSEKVEKAEITEMEYQFLYFDGDFIIFMNMENYEQESVHKSKMTDMSIKFLKDEMMVRVHIYDDNIILISLPDQIECKIIETEPSIKGQTVTSTYKPAILENGIKIMVPQHMSENDRIIVSTEDITYVKQLK